MKLFRVKSVKYDSPVNAKLCFGVPLDQQSTAIPSIVEKCTAWLNKHATATEGVFRLSPNHATLEELQAKFDKGENIDLDAPMTLTTSGGKMTGMIDAHTIAGLLKKWFRELPEPLCTMEMYDMWMAAATINDPPTKKMQVKKVLSFCPPANQLLIKYLARFLRQFATHSEATKMTSSNLSICFAPNLLRAPDTIGLADQIEESPIATSLLVMFIEDFAEIFDEEAPTIPTSSATSASTAAAASPKAAPKKSSLTANLPPPPVSSNPNGAAPVVTTKKPAPKYMPGAKKVGGLSKSQSGSSMPSASSPSPDVVPRGTNSGASSPTPVDASLDSSSSSSLSTSNESPSPLAASGPPPVAEKPKNIEKKFFRQSVKMTGGLPPLDNGMNLSSSNSKLPPPLGPPPSSILPPPISGEGSQISALPEPISSENEPRSPPTRPKSSAPVFARNLSSSSR